MLPFVNVSHLPSSTSFYAAVLQPLGLSYISGASTLEALTPVSFNTVTFGTRSPPCPVLQLRQADSLSEPLRLSRIVISAPSPAAVADAEACADRANPPSLELVDHRVLLRQFHGGPDDSGESRVRVADLDGNIMEMVYVPPPNYSPKYGGSTIRRTQSTHDEVSRILDWNYDVVASSPKPSNPRSEAGRPPLPMARRPGRSPDDQPITVIRRSVTTSILEPSPRQNSSGLTTSTVVGTLLGVAAGAAAGAAITYSMTKSERARAPRQEFDVPGFQRRSTCPDLYPQERRGRFVEIERTIEKVGYPESYASLVEQRAPPQYVARYSRVGAGRSREVDDIYDNRSRHSSRFEPKRSSSVRSRSEAPAGRTPLMIADVEYDSHVSSRHSAVPKSNHRSTLDDDHESYVSARSKRSSATVRPPRPAAVHTELTSRSRMSAAKSSGAPPPVSFPPNASRSHSIVSPRHVALPPSGIGSSHADWDDDAGSVAPSDSISCVGSRRSGRRYY